MQPSPAIDALKSQVDRALGLREAVQRQLEATKREIKRLEEEGALLNLVSGLFRTLIDQEVTAGVKAVERLETEGLQAIFNDQDLKVRADVQVQHGKVSVDLITIQKKPDGTVVEGASEGVFGGAVTTIESILLRVMVILRRGLRPLLILDESLPALREPYLSNTGKFLSLLCARVGLDILLVLSDQTGSLVGTADKAYKLVVKDGAATFEGIR